MYKKMSNKMGYMIFERSYSLAGLCLTLKRWSLRLENSYLWNEYDGIA